jgi:signal transduction histidine kinase
LRWTATYMAAWAFWIAFFLFYRLSWISFPVHIFQEQASPTAALILCVLFFYLTSASLSKDKPKPAWAFIAGGWLVLYILSQSNQSYVQNLLTSGLRIEISSGLIRFFMLIGGWWPFFLGSALAAAQAYRSSLRYPQQKKRVNFWWIALLLTHSGFLLVFITVLSRSDTAPGIALALAGAAASIYSAQKQTALQPESPSRTLREYNLQISNILEPVQLSSTAIDLIRNAVNAQSGILYIVRKHANSQEDFVYRLQGILGEGEELPSEKYLSANSSIPNFFIHENRPITSLEIKNYLNRPGSQKEELDWLTTSNSQIFVPILIKNEWLGLIALGARETAESYNNEDYDFLAILADQTGIALQNAWLVENLTHVNQDLKRAYYELERANQQLERLDQTKSDFISICSHELRTPISVIRGYSEILKDQTEVKQHAYQAKLVSGIQTGINRLHEIVETMLDMASIDTRSLELHKEQSSLPVIIRLAAESFKKIIIERQLTLKFEGLRGLPEVEADSEALLKVFNHLLANAVKFTPNRGCITIAGKPDLENGSIELIIQDTGIGIAREMQELIFNKFYQTGKLGLHSSGKTKFKGAGPGLGLAITKGIVEAHGGKIWVESPGYDEEKCPGSAFHILLPLKR